MATAQIDRNLAKFTIAIPVADYQGLLMHELDGRNFRQLAQDLIREFVASSPRVQAARAKQAEAKADAAYAQIESFMAASAASATVKI